MITDSFVFFDIGNTLGSVHLTSGGDSIDEIKVFPGIKTSLENLTALGVKLGILSDKGEIDEQNILGALDNAGLLTFFDGRLILFGPKDSTILFEEGAAAAEVIRADAETEPLLLFVGENSQERLQAHKAGFHVASSPELAIDVLREEWQ